MNFNCFFGIGVAHFISEHYEEALSWIRKSMVAHPGSDFPLRALAACLGLLGRTPEAREVIRQYRQVAPDATISKVMAITPYRDADFRRRYAEGLRKAGLPE
jgi:adenylate cyclase